MVIDSVPKIEAEAQNEEQEGDTSKTDGEVDERAKSKARRDSWKVKRKAEEFGAHACVVIRMGTHKRCRNAKTCARSSGRVAKILEPVLGVQ